jgi:hypothetical protein
MAVPATASPGQPEVIRRPGLRLGLSGVHVAAAASHVGHSRPNGACSAACGARVHAPPLRSVRVAAHSSAVRRGPCPVAARHPPRCCCGTCRAAASAAHLRFAPSALRPGYGCAYASRIVPRSLRLRRAGRLAHSRPVRGAPALAAPGYASRRCGRRGPRCPPRRATPQQRQQQQQQQRQHQQRKTKALR